MYWLRFLCVSVGLGVSVVKFRQQTFTAEAQRTHRATESKPGLLFTSLIGAIINLFPLTSRDFSTEGENYARQLA